MTLVLVKLKSLCEQPLSRYKNNKQVCILVPTTLLAQQHYQNFVDRFADWPVEVAELSRFRTSKEQKQTLERLAAGKVDIIIGTHKLLSNRG